MKILAVPDLHCWYSGPKDEQERVREFRECAAEIDRVATEQRVTCALYPGDFFVTNRPSPSMMQAIIRMLSSVNYFSVGIAGNHDLTAPGQPCFVDVLADMNPLWGITEPKVVTRGNMAIAAIPSIKGITDDQLLGILYAKIAELPNAKYKIVMAHYATDISTYSSGEMALGKEPVFRMADLQGMPVDAVILGHIHKPGILSDGSQGPIILHTGALTRRDHGEGKDERLFYIADLDSKAITSHPLPARKFVTVNPTMPMPDVKDACVRFVWDTTDEALKMADTKAWEQQAYEAGAFFVTGFHPRIERTERTRAEGLTEQTSPIQAWEMWLGTQNAAQEINKAATVEIEKILKEVAA